MQKTPCVPTLAETQALLQKAIFQSRRSDRAPSRDRDRALNLIAPLAPLSPEKRLKIYSTGWFLRHEESLLDDYEETARAIGLLSGRTDRCGESLFAEVVAEFIEKCPSESYTLVAASDPFPEFLIESPVTQEMVAQNPWIYELARLERAVYQAFHARDAQTWSMDTLRDLNESEMASVLITTQPTVQLLKNRWTVRPLWLGACDSVQEFQHEPEFLLVFRRNFQVEVRSITEVEWRILDEVMQGCTLDEYLVHSSKEGAMDTAVSRLSGWAAEGVVRASC